MAEIDRPVGIGTLVTVDTIVPVDINAVATAVRDMAGRSRTTGIYAYPPRNGTVASAELAGSGAGPGRSEASW